MKVCKTCWGLLQWQGSYVRANNVPGLNIVELAFYYHNKEDHPAMRLRFKS